MAAPLGNKNGTKQRRLVGDMLRKVAAQNPEKLRKACESLLDKMADGDVLAFREFSDRVDGKSVQSTEMTLTTGNSAERVDDDTLANIATGSGNRTPEEKKGEEAIH